MFLPMAMADQFHPRVDAGDRNPLNNCRSSQMASGSYLVHSAGKNNGPTTLTESFNYHPRASIHSSPKGIDVPRSRLASHHPVHHPDMATSTMMSKYIAPSTRQVVAHDIEIRDLNSERREDNQGDDREKFFTYNQTVVFGGCDWIDKAVALDIIQSQLSGFQKRGVRPDNHTQIGTGASSLEKPNFDTIRDLHRHLSDFHHMIGQSWVRVDPKVPGKPLCQDKLAWSDFTQLAYLMKKMAYINDNEFPPQLDGKTGKFIMTGSPLPTLDQDMEFIPIFKPMGTIQLNRALLLRLRTITGPIKVQGKYPTKDFDGKSRKDKTVAQNELRHKLQVSETEFKTFMQSSTLSDQWNKKSVEKQRQICRQLIDSLTLLFLYWAYFLHKERRLSLAIESERVKKTFRSLLSERLSAYLEKDSDLAKAFPFNDVDGVERKVQENIDRNSSDYSSSNGSYTHQISSSSSHSSSSDRQGRYKSESTAITTNGDGSTASGSSGSIRQFQEPRTYSVGKLAIRGEQHNLTLGQSRAGQV